MPKEVPFGVVAVKLPLTARVALVELETGGEMPPVVVTFTVIPQLPGANDGPVEGLTLNVSAEEVAPSAVIGMEAGATVQLPEVTAAVAVAVRVAGLAGAAESAALVVQLAPGVPAEAGLGVQFSVVRVMVGGAATAIITLAVATVAA